MMPRMVPRMVWAILLVLCLSAEGFATEQEQAAETPPISPKDRKIVEMLDILELMEMVEYMEILKDLKATAGDGNDADNDKKDE